MDRKPSKSKASPKLRSSKNVVHCASDRASVSIGNWPGTWVGHLIAFHMEMESPSCLQEKINSEDHDGPLVSESGLLVDFEMESSWSWPSLRRRCCRDSLATFILKNCARHVGTTDSCYPVYLGMVGMLVFPSFFFKWEKKNPHFYLQQFELCRKIVKVLQKFLCAP